MPLSQIEQDTLIQELLESGFVLTDYPEQQLITYAKTVPIQTFMSKNGKFENYLLYSVVDTIENLGDSVTIEFVPFTNCAQWCTHNADNTLPPPVFTEHEVFNFTDEEREARALLELFAS